MMLLPATTFGSTLLVNLLPVLAQADKAQPATAPWISAAVAVLLAACMVGVSLLSSKRTHRD